MSKLVLISLLASKLQAFELKILNKVSKSKIQYVVKSYFWSGPKLFEPVPIWRHPKRLGHILKGKVFSLR